MENEKNNDEKFKLLILADEDIYQIFKEFDNKFDRNSYNVFHFNSNKIINYAINNVDGIPNLTHVIIQKSFYKNKDLERILQKFKYFNPNVKVIIYLDYDISFYELFVHHVVKNSLGYVVTSPNEFAKFEKMNFNIEQDNYILKKISHRQKKYFNAY